MSESALCRAVRDEIRLHADFQNRQVNVELDEEAPPTAHDVYAMVISAGVQSGPSHDTNSGASDLLYNVDVALAIRAPKKPRDRRRELFIALASSFETFQNAIAARVDFQYDVLAAANAYILAETASAEGFIEPLKMAPLAPFRAARAELFAAGLGEQVAAIIRRIHFRGARRIVTRTQN